MIPRVARQLCGGALVALVLGAVAAGGASASPAWLVGEPELATGEFATVTGDAVLGSIGVSGVTVTCKKAHYEMTVYNYGGIGMVSGFESLAFTTCVATEGCTVKWARGAKLPWNGHLVTSAGYDYVVFLKAAIEIYFESGGAGCPLNNTLVLIKGSAGALYDNPTETFTFSIASFGATSTKLPVPNRTGRMGCGLHHRTDRPLRGPIAHGGLAPDPSVPAGSCAALPFAGVGPE